MSTLAEYLKDKKKGDFADKIGTSPSYLSQILSGYRKPSLAMMARIQSASEGEVDFNSWSSSLSSCEESLPATENMGNAAQIQEATHD